MPRPQIQTREENMEELRPLLSTQLPAIARVNGWVVHASAQILEVLLDSLYEMPWECLVNPNPEPLNNMQDGQIHKLLLLVNLLKQYPAAATFNRLWVRSRARRGLHLKAVA